MHRILCMLFLTAGLVGAGASYAQITVTMPWIRATVPGQKVAAAYMEIKSGEPVALVAARSPAAKRTEIHEMKMENNIMKMGPIARLEIPRGKTVALTPGGYHVMMIDILHPLKKGDSVPVTLTFEDRSRKTRTVEVKAEVRDSPPAAHTGDGMH